MWRWKARVFAQSLVEYGSLSGFGAALASLPDLVIDTVENLSVETWLTVGAFFLLVFLLLRRRSRRL